MQSDLDAGDTDIQCLCCLANREFLYITHKEKPADIRKLFNRPLNQIPDLILLAASPQTPDHSLTLQEKHSLQFSRTQETRCRGNRSRPQDSQEQLGVNIPTYDGDRTFELPVPATFLVSTDGKVLKSYVEADYMQRLDPETALAWVREL
jgi:peroxiredoxin